MGRRRNCCMCIISLFIPFVSVEPLGHFELLPLQLVFIVHHVQSVLAEAGGWRVRSVACLHHHPAVLTCSGNLGVLSHPALDVKHWVFKLVESLPNMGGSWYLSWLAWLNNVWSGEGTVFTYRHRHRQTDRLNDNEEKKKNVLQRWRGALNFQLIHTRNRTK